jgi:stage II sporulation protein D
VKPLFLITLISLMLCHEAAGMSERLKIKASQVRVLITSSARNVQIHGSRIYVLDRQNRPLFQIEGAVKVLPSPQGFYINQTAVAGTLIELRSASGVFSLSGKSYKGSLLLSRQGAGMDLINKVFVEDYLKGVVACEMDNKAPLEAFKAQAIAARTYTLFHIQKNANLEFDIGLPQSSQLYSGMAAEKPRVSQAVDATRGIVMLYHKDIFPAFYHTVCGGSTVEAGLVWPSAIRCPPGSRCWPCRKNLSAPWKYEISKFAFKNKLRQKGLKFSTELRIRVFRDVATQRVLYLEVNSQRLMGNQLRLIFGPQNIRSTLFWIESKHGTLTFLGKGWGHGVGLCQYGAARIAEDGQNYAAILSNYYPDCVLNKIY